MPHSDWTEPELPNVGLIRTIARRWGYAIAEHGTQERDVDLIAAPWTENAAPADILVHYICEGIGARIADRSVKPLGRNAYNLQMDGWYKLIDLSICPRVTVSATEIETLRRAEQVWREQSLEQSHELADLRLQLESVVPPVREPLPERVRDAVESTRIGAYDPIDQITLSEFVVAQFGDKP